MSCTQHVFCLLPHKPRKGRALHTMNCSHNNICTTHARVIQARAASTVKNMYRLSSLLPMYVDVCTRYMWYRYRCTTYHVPPVCCVCVCTTVPTCVVPCTSTIPTVFIIFINYCISHQLFNSHSQLTLTTYTHNFTNVYRTQCSTYVAHLTP